MKNALGIIEIKGLATAIKVADAMVKTANVVIKEIEPAKGMGFMTVKIVGDVGAVNAAISVGKQTAMDCDKLVTSYVIARMAKDTEKAFLPTPAPEAAAKSVKESAKDAAEGSVKESAKDTAEGSIKESAKKSSAGDAQNTSASSEVKKEVKRTTKRSKSTETKTSGKSSTSVQSEESDSGKA